MICTKRTDSGLFIITLFVTGDHYNYTSGQTDIFVTDWPGGRLHHWPEDAWGVEHCCLFLLLQSLSHCGWRASPKRLARSSKYSSSLRATQTRSDRQIAGDYRRDIFTSSHDPNVLNIHVSDRGDKSGWFIWSSHLCTLRFPFQRDSGCMEGGSSSRHRRPAHTTGEHTFMKKCRVIERRRRRGTRREKGNNASGPLKCLKKERPPSRPRLQSHVYRNCLGFLLDHPRLIFQRLYPGGLYPYIVLYIQNIPQVQNLLRSHQSRHEIVYLWAADYNLWESYALFR